MSDADALIQMCLAAPSDATRRGALADWCAENNEPEIEAALRGPAGETVIRMLWRYADDLKRTACLRLLWSVAVVIWHSTSFATPAASQGIVSAEETLRALGYPPPKEERK